MFQCANIGTYTDPKEASKECQGQASKYYILVETKVPSIPENEYLEE
jgi:hypothetical protein